MAKKPPSARNLNEYPPLLTVADATELLQVNHNTIYSLLREGKLPHITIGRQKRIPRRWMAAFCGVNEDDLADQRRKRQEEIDALLARYRLAQDEVSRVTLRLLELGVLVKDANPATDDATHTGRAGRRDYAQMGGTPHSCADDTRKD